MTFTTLAERFEQRSKDIYGKFSPSADQFVAIKPDTTGVFGSRSRVIDDSRALPVISTARDLRRVSRFLTSPEGLLFIGKQTLLQTANTFANTKLYNPLSPLLNVIPFIHARRHIPISIVLGGTSGLLQNSTVNNVANRVFVTNQINGATPAGLGNRASSVLRSTIRSQLRNVVGLVVPAAYATSRPEYEVFIPSSGPMLFPPQPLNMRGLPKTNVTANIVATVVNKARTALVKGAISILNRQLPRKIRDQVTIDTNPPQIYGREDPTPNFEQAAKNFRENFRGNSRVRSDYLDERITVFGQTPGKTELKDPFNLLPAYQYNQSALPPGDPSARRISALTITASGTKSDIIKFIFKDASGQNPVHFRALLSSIKESVKPEFNEQRYVGRTERFVTYGGAKRGLSLSFNIVAFSPGEIDGMWSRVNYLTGLAFPSGVKNGFMVPPLFKMTIGELYDSQPCYIEALEYDFLDETITFDVDREVPHAINVTMQLSILEKRSKFYDSPFYRITEDVADNENMARQGTRIQSEEFRLQEQSEADARLLAAIAARQNVVGPPAP